MRKIVLFDPSYGTLNLGDQIINEALMEEISPILEGNFVARFSTHTPILHDYQMILSTGVREYCSEAWLKLLGGTNLIKTSLISKKPGWNLNPISARLYEGAVGVGVGIGGNGGIKNTYTRNIYRRVLSRRYVHSTRDQRTADVLSGLGAHAVNTGCPTMWALTPEHCATIPTGRARSVIFTVTDYAADPQADLGILQVLERNYEEIFVWIQGSRDYEYLQELGVLSRISIVGPSVKAYRDFLVANDVDYVGTRLHGGVYALRHRRRAIIVAVDHRAMDIQTTHNLNVVQRGNLSELERMVEGSLATSVQVDTQVIREWMGQFVADAI